MAASSFVFGVSRECMKMLYNSCFDEKNHLFCWRNDNESASSNDAPPEKSCRCQSRKHLTSLQRINLTGWNKAVKPVLQERVLFFTWERKSDWSQLSETRAQSFKYFLNQKWTNIRKPAYQLRSTVFMAEEPLPIVWFWVMLTFPGMIWIVH